MARYQIEISDELLRMHAAGELTLPDGWRIAEATDEQAGNWAAHWCWVEDDGAPEDLEGQRVEVTFQSDGHGTERVVVVLDRRPIGAAAPPEAQPQRTLITEGG